jgi:hypothetical protein
MPPPEMDLLVWPVTGHLLSVMIFLPFIVLTDAPQRNEKCFGAH